MNAEKCIELIESIVEDSSIPEEIRDELEWISYEDLQDGIDMEDLLSNLKETCPLDIYPAKVQELFDSFIK